jgi:hypothetical protein
MDENIALKKWIKILTKKRMKILHRKNESKYCGVWSYT